MGNRLKRSKSRSKGYINRDCPPGSGTMDGGLEFRGSSEKKKRTDRGSICSLFKIVYETSLAHERSLTNKW